MSPLFKILLQCLVFSMTKQKPEPWYLFIIFCDLVFIERPALGMHDLCSDTQPCTQRAQAWLNALLWPP